MAEKIKSEIIHIDLTEASYKGTSAYIDPTYVNFFFGNNGVGKSTIAKAIQSGAGVTYASGKSSADYLPLVYNQEFIDENFRSYRNMRGVFTLNAKNAATQKSIEDRTAERTETQKKKSAANEKKEKAVAAQSKLQRDFYKECWDREKALREEFSKTQAGKGKSEPFAKEILKHTPQDIDLEELRRLYSSAFADTAKKYPRFNEVSNPGILDNLANRDILSTSIVNSADTHLAVFLRKIGATEFLYFYHLVYGSSSEDGETREKIVVIDDPVSSMDSGSLFIVSTLVKQMIEVCRNNADNRDKVADGNFIKQIFILTHNAYFHREITYGYVSKYEYVSFYLIRKRNGKSTIRMYDDKNPDIPTERINVNPVKNSYAALWDEYKEVKSAIPLMNVIRRILEYYFLQLCGYEGSTLRKVILIDGKAEGKFNDTSGNFDQEKYQLASAMLSYIHVNAIGMNDGRDFVDECLSTDECRAIFEMIFEEMKQKQHYEMMMRN